VRGQTSRLASSFEAIAASDLSLQTPVASSKIAASSQGLQRPHRVEGGASGVGLAEDQRLAQLAEVGRSSRDQRKPRPVRSLAVEAMPTIRFELDDEAL